MTSILEKIKIHIQVYKKAGLEIPPIRITYKEHLQLASSFLITEELPESLLNDNTFLRRLLEDCRKKRNYLMASFYGVEIEVVAKIEV